MKVAVVVKSIILRTFAQITQKPLWLKQTRVLSRQIQDYVLFKIMR